jgi:hypothetical protein
VSAGLDRWSSAQGAEIQEEFPMRNTTMPILAMLAWLLGTAGVVPVAAQSGSVPRADIERLQDLIDDTDAALTQLRTRDATLARTLQADLDDLREEVTYLKVKARKAAVSWAEHDEVRARIDEVRRRAHGDRHTSPAGSVTPVATAGYRTQAGEIPVGQELDVRLQSRLSSETAQVEDRFTATTLVDLYQGDAVIVPAGSALRGIVSSVDKAGRLDRKGSLTLAFDEITVRGVAYPLRATVTQAIESKGVRGEGARLGIGAAAGAILGGIIGGAQGAVAGIFIGSGGVLAAVPGKDVELDAGTVLRVRFDSPVVIGS